MSKEARGIFNVLFVVGAVGAGLYASRGPWMAYRKQRAVADQAQSQMRLVERERTELARKNAYLDSATGREETARNHGYLKPGEVRLEVAP